MPVSERARKFWTMARSQVCVLAPDHAEAVERRGFVPDCRDIAMHMPILIVAGERESPD